MAQPTRLLAFSAIALMLAACGGQEAEETETMTFLRPEATADLVMELPVTTSSTDAANQFLQGQRAMDMGRFIDAYAHFTNAIEADQSFAVAYLQAANAAPTLDAFKANLDSARQLASNVTRAEQVLIEIAQRGFLNDVDGQLQLANELVEVQSTSPRAWLTLAGIQTTMNDHEGSRASITKAIELAPEFSVSYIQLGNSYLFGEPKDFSKARENMERAVELEPNESLAHDFLGDAYRALGDLENARDAYTRAAELDPTNGSPLQQRGHVNSFLGNYEAARTDYDSAITLGRDNQKASYSLYRAFVHVHAGNPQAAIDELNDLVGSINTMGIPEPTGWKVSVLTNIAIIALHHGEFTAAEQALVQRKQLMNEQSTAVGTDEFRRSQDANIAYFDGMLAARRGDYETANAKVEEYTRLMEPDANPRKMEAAHQLMGLTNLLTGNHTEAVSHFEQGNPNDPYTWYHLALAHEGAGNVEEAQRLFGKVADYNFNNVTFALVRAEAMEKRQ